MAGLLDQWRKIAYNEQADRTELQNFWDTSHQSSGAVHYLFP